MTSWCSPSPRRPWHEVSSPALRSPAFAEPPSARCACRTRRARRCGRLRRPPRFHGGAEAPQEGALQESAAGASGTAGAFGFPVSLPDARFLARGLGLEVREVWVAGRSRLPAEELRTALAVERGDLIFAHDLARMQERVAALGWVESADPSPPPARRALPRHPRAQPLRAPPVGRGAGGGGCGRLGHSRRRGRRLRWLAPARRARGPARGLRPMDNMGRRRRVPRQPVALGGAGRRAAVGFGPQPTA